jgi:hypothetical protein
MNKNINICSANYCIYSYKLPIEKKNYLTNNNNKCSYIVIIVISLMLHFK